MTIKLMLAALLLPMSLLAQSVQVNSSGKQVSIKNDLLELVFDLEKGTYLGKNLKEKITFFSNASFRLDPPMKAWRKVKTTYRYEVEAVKDKFGVGKQLKIYHKPSKGYAPERILLLTVYEEQPFAVIGFGIKNSFKFPVRIRQIEPLSGAELFVGQRVQDPKVLRGGAGAEPNFVENNWQLDAINSGLLTYKDNDQRRTLVAGGLKYKEFARRIEIMDGVKSYFDQDHYNIKDYMAKYEVSRKGYRQMTLLAWDPQGKRIPANSTYIADDSIYLDFVTTDPFQSLEQFGMAMRQANNARPNNYDFPTLCGWMVASKHGEGKAINNSPGLVNEMDVAKKSGLLKYTPLAVRLEPDYYCHRNNGDTQQGWWDDEHFKKYGSLRGQYDTFAKFCQAVTDRGGVPFTYFQGSMPSNDFALAHPEWMLNNDISLLHYNHAHHRPLVRYDYSDPGFQKHTLAVWKRLAEGGLKGVKMDYPETAWARFGGFEDKSYTTSSAYRKLYELCREGLGPDAFIHERLIGKDVHENIPRTEVTAGVADMQRVWGDSSQFEPEMASRIGLRWYKNRVVYGYYPDGKAFIKKHNGKKLPLPTHQRRTFLTMVGLGSGRLELGTSFGSMNQDMIRDITRLYPMINETKSPRPVDMLTGKEHPEIYTYDVSPGWTQVILINNDTEKEKLIDAALSGDQADTGSLGLDADKNYHIFDFWNQKYIGKFKGSDKLAIQQQAGEALVYSVREVANHPQVISTNRHIMQGMMELSELKWNAETSMLSGKAQVIAGETMVISIATNGKDVKSVSKGSISNRTEAKGLIDLKLDSKKNEQVSFSIHF